MLTTGRYRMQIYRILRVLQVPFMLASLFHFYAEPKELMSNLPTQPLSILCVYLLNALPKST